MGWGGLRSWRRTSAEGRGLRAARDHWVPGVAAARSAPAPPLWTRRRFAMAAEAQLHARFPEHAAAGHELRARAEMPLNFFEPVGQLIDPDESAEPQSRKRLGAGGRICACARRGRGLCQFGERPVGEQSTLWAGPRSLASL